MGDGSGGCKTRVLGQMEIRDARALSLRGLAHPSRGWRYLFCFPQLIYLKRFQTAPDRPGGAKPLPAWLLLVNLLEICNAGPKMQRGAIAAPGAWPLGMVPTAGAREINTTRTTNFSRSSEGREQRKRAVQ